MNGGRGLRLRRSASIAVVADDLTGAADASLGFCQTGFSAVVIWADGLEDGASGGSADVLAIDTGSRSAGAADAAAAAGHLVSRLRTAGIRTLYKKIDSTLRGHIAGELAATLPAWHPDAVAIVAPAFPRAGRTWANGRLRVDGRTVDGPTLRARLERAGVSTLGADLATVRGGALTGRLQAPGARAGQPRAVVCDAETDEDLAAIARAGVTLGWLAVWVGSGGLAAALAASLTAAGRPVDREPLPRVSGPVLAVVGSRTAIAIEQARHLIAGGAKWCPCPPLALEGGDAAAGDRCIAAVLDHLRRGEDVLVTLADAGALDGPSASSGSDDRRLTAQLGVLLRPAAALAGGLILTGGDTASGLLRAWGTRALRIVSEIEAGIPVSVSEGACRMPIVTKAGAFGGPASLTLARELLRRA